MATGPLESHALVPGSGLSGTSVRKRARQPYDWSASHLFHLIWTLAKNIPTQIRVMRVLSSQEYSRFLEVNPRLPWKWMAVDYLARGLTISEQAECFIHHYRRLSALFPKQVLRQLLLGEILLDKTQVGNDCFSVKMTLSEVRLEGELSLSFEVNGRYVFVLSFTIVPGWVVGSESREILLISRVQGVKGCYSEIQLATKAMSEIAPPAVLFAALSGFAEAFGFDAVAGINATMKPEYYTHAGEAEHIEQAYDEFLSELGAAKGPAGFYLSPLPPPEKPLTLVKKGHKTRTRVKRALKREIAQRICRLLLETCKRM